MAVSLAAAQEASALPGGGPLAGIAAQLNGDSAAIAGIADNWKQSAQSGQQHTAAVNDAVSQVAADWKGTAQQAFTGLMEKFAAASRKVQEPLLVGSKALTDASNTIEAAQKTVEGICERLLAYASKARSLGTANNVKPADINAAISKAAAEAVSECQTAVKQANSALKQVSSTLSSALTSMGDGTFSSLPTPGSGGVSPTSTGSGPSLSGTPSGGAPVSGGGGGGGGGGAPGPVPSGVVSGSMVQNAKTIYDYLIKNGYSKVGAAGIVACIYGESTLNPEAQGSGGWGLIGFTPQFPGEYANLMPTGNASADLAKQLPAIIQYNNGWSQFKPMLNSATSVQQAADIYSQYFERPAVLDSDVHATGIAIAQQVSGLH